MQRHKSVKDADTRHARIQAGAEPAYAPPKIGKKKRKRKREGKKKKRRDKKKKTSGCLF